MIYCKKTGAIVQGSLRPNAKQNWDQILNEGFFFIKVVYLKGIGTLSKDVKVAGVLQSVPTKTSLIANPAVPNITDS